MPGLDPGIHQLQKEPCEEDGLPVKPGNDWNGIIGHRRLRDASAAARGRFELMPMGIHWPELDEDLGVAGMLRGRQAV